MPPLAPTSPPRRRAGTVVLGSAGAVITKESNDGRATTIPVTLAGAAASEPQAIDKLPGVVNDLRGDDRSQWRTNVPTFSRVRYPAVYPGIAMDYHGTTGTLEYDFHLAPHADPSQIAVGFGGAPLRIAKSGALVAGAHGRAIRQAAPVAYQPNPDGSRDPVDASFAIHGGKVGFDLGAYDSTRPLVIDPLVLSYSTYLGGTGDDEALRDRGRSAGQRVRDRILRLGQLPNDRRCLRHDPVRDRQLSTPLSPSSTRPAALSSTRPTSAATTPDVGADVGSRRRWQRVCDRVDEVDQPARRSANNFPAGALNTSNDDGFGDAFVAQAESRPGTALIYSVGSAVSTWTSRSGW